MNTGKCCESRFHASLSVFNMEAWAGIGVPQGSPQGGDVGKDTKEAVHHKAPSEEGGQPWSDL